MSKNYQNSASKKMKMTRQIFQTRAAMMQQVFDFTGLTHQPTQTVPPIKVFRFLYFGQSLAFHPNKVILHHHFYQKIALHWICFPARLGEHVHFFQSITLWRGRTGVMRVGVK